MARKNYELKISPRAAQINNLLAENPPKIPVLPEIFTRQPTDKEKEKAENQEKLAKLAIVRIDC